MCPSSIEDQYLQYKTFYGWFYVALNNYLNTLFKSKTFSVAQYPAKHCLKASESSSFLPHNMCNTQFMINQKASMKWGP